MDKSERPFPLMLVVMLYFIIGFMALTSLLTGTQSDLLSILFLFISYGLLTKNRWALVGFQSIVILQALALLFTLVMQLLPGEGVAHIGFGGMEFQVSPVLLNLIFIVYVGFQSFVAFSKETSAYISNT